MLDPYIRLKEAIILDKLTIVKLLLRRYPDLLHAKDAHNKGWSLLHYASYYGNYLVCVFLIQLGCDSNDNIAKDFTGKSAIHLSILKGDEQTCHLLLQHFPKTIEYKDFEGNSPLLLACKYGHYKVLTLLISCAANINITNNTGDNGLHMSLKYGHLECCKSLLQYGLNDEMLNNDGLRPDEVAFTFELQKRFLNMVKEVIPLNNNDLMDNNSVLNNNNNANNSLSENSSLQVNETSNILTTNPISDAIGNPFKSKKPQTKHGNNNGIAYGRPITVSTTSGSFPTSSTKESEESAENKSYIKKPKEGDDDDTNYDGAVATPLLSCNNNKIMFPFALKNDSNYSLPHSLHHNDISSTADSKKYGDSLSLGDEESAGNDELTSLKSSETIAETKRENNKRKSLLAKVPISKVRNSDSNG